MMCLRENQVPKPSSGPTSISTRQAPACWPHWPSPATFGARRFGLPKRSIVGPWRATFTPLVGFFVGLISLYRILISRSEQVGGGVVGVYILYYEYIKETLGIVCLSIQASIYHRVRSTLDPKLEPETPDRVRISRLVSTSDIVRGHTTILLQHTVICPCPSPLVETLKTSEFDRSGGMGFRGLRLRGSGSRV